MKYVTRLLVIFMLSPAANCSVQAQPLRELQLKEYAKRNGLVPAESVLPPIDKKKSAAGRLLFESKKLSLGEDTSCSSCHLSRFGSADGLPNAVGTRAHGEGAARLRSGGDVIPRNTLPLWGRGAVGFNVFFWDGRVSAENGAVHSQFGADRPSDDPLVVTAHLPFVEIREMVPDTDQAQSYTTESLEAARQIYQTLADRIRDDRTLSAPLAFAYGVEVSDIKIIHVADSIATFIRDRFRIRTTRFHRFVFDDETLDEQELAGGLLFYGKARCSTCHNGAFFSDQEFYAIPFGQLGFGKNGFGIDYGRFNVTLDPDDRYKFRTPPLLNVEHTSPYSHSGSVYELSSAVRAHVDPLSAVDVSAMSAIERVEFYKRLRIWSQQPIHEVYLDAEEVDALVAFLKTLTFEDPEANSNSK